MLDAALVDKWWNGRLTDAELAHALGAPSRVVGMILPHFQGDAQTGGRGGWKHRRLPSRVRVGLAVAYALHRSTNLTIEQSASLVGGIPFVCESVAATIDFVPMASASVCTLLNGDRADARILNGLEYDPMGWLDAGPLGAFSPTYAGLDEYLELADSFVYWTRPAHDVTALLNARVGRSILEADSSRTIETLGCIRDGVFMPVPARQEPWPPELPHPTQSYRTKTSINLSAAARSMKRRAIGLPVVDLTDQEAVTAFWSNQPKPR